MDREAWCAVLHGVAKSLTRMSDWTELNWRSIPLLGIRTPNRYSYLTLSSLIWKIIVSISQVRTSRFWVVTSRISSAQPRKDLQPRSVHLQKSRFFLIKVDPKLSCSKTSLRANDKRSFEKWINASIGRTCLLLLLGDSLVCASLTPAITDFAEPLGWPCSAEVQWTWSAHCFPQCTWHSMSKQGASGRPSAGRYLPTASYMTP